jgi:hypothetical protein
MPWPLDSAGRLFQATNWPGPGENCPQPEDANTTNPIAWEV